MYVKDVTFTDYDVSDAHHVLAGVELLLVPDI